ncbi:MAG: hypothetical protein H6744_06325 [Deltaproteobacteria bacterium]|nr:hypothetical protein [Deltaproteobacteria bacterium]MCB9786296.1 hypothetical protein [Deltaproteobacteria bacterium]
MTRPSHDPSVRLAVFVERGLIPRLPTAWQLFCAQVEMIPYVVMADDGDAARYAGAPLGHPLLRTPVVFSQVGRDHLRIGHGLHSTALGVFRHLSYVLHEGYPVYDLQLVQTHPDGLERLRRHLRDVEAATTRAAARERRLVDLVIPEASAYRRRFLEPGGWIDRAAAFDYPDPSALPPFIRHDFSSLVAFANYAADTFPERARDAPLRGVPAQLVRLAGRRFTRDAFPPPPG